MPAWVDRRILVGAGVALAVALLLIVFDLSASLVIGLVNGAVYGIVAIGLVLIYKSSGIFNFAQGEFGTVSVFVLWLLLERNIPYVLAILAALAVGAGFGLAVDRTIIRPLFSSPRVILLVATAGVALLAVGLQFWFGGALLRNVPPLMGRLDRLSIFGVFVSDQRLLVLGVLALLGGSLAYFFNRTDLGLAIIGASQEPTATELVGISVKRLSAMTWALSGLIGAVAAVFTVPIGGSFGPGFLTIGASSALIPGFTAAVLGGMTSLPGAFVGGTIVGVAQSVALSANVFEGIPGPDTVVVFGILLAVLVVRPQGLFGRTA